MGRKAAPTERGENGFYDAAVNAKAIVSHWPGPMNRRETYKTTRMEGGWGALKVKPGKTKTRPFRKGGLHNTSLALKDEITDPYETWGEPQQRRRLEREMIIRSA